MKSFVSNITFFVALSIFALALTASFTLASEKSEMWQLTMEYDQTSLRAKTAAICEESTKKIITPGIAGAPAKVSYKVEWLGQSGEILYTTNTLLPLGSITPKAEDELCIHNISDSGFLILRLHGPSLNSNPKSLRLTQPMARRATGYSDQLPTLFTQHSLDVPIGSLGATAFTPDGPVSSQKLRDTGPDENRLVFVILGDGYTAANLANGDFDADAQALTASFDYRKPWDVLHDATNVYQISVESVDEGSDNNPLGTYIDTYFHSSYYGGSHLCCGDPRQLVITEEGFDRAVAAADAFVGVGLWDQLVMVVNSITYGGLGGQISIVSMSPNHIYVFVHEIGHTFAGLADVYPGGNTGLPAETPEANADLNFNPPKWDEWILPGTPLPTPATGYDSLIGAFEGAKGYPGGVYRPSNECLMFLSGEPCLVCNEAHYIAMDNHINLLDDHTPNTSPYLLDTAGMQFWSTPQSFNGITFQWKVNGLIPSCGNEQTFDLNGLELPDFVNTVELVVNYPTVKVRQDTIVDSFYWTAIRDCNDNGINDSLDILAGESDANNNGIIDSFEGVGCCDTPGDADGSGSSNIADVTYLIARIFSGGPAPLCKDEGDADASGSVNIADVTYLIARIFSGGPPPECLFMGSGDAEWAGLSCAMPDDIYAIWGLADDDIYAVGNGGLILHYDGFGWEKKEGGAGNELVSIWGSAADDIFAIGLSGGVILHYNGLEWTSQSGASNSNLFSIWGSGPSDIFIAGFNKVQHCNGSSWSISHSESFSFLYGVWGSASDDVYVVGSSGKMLHYDGAWSTLPTVTTKDLNAIWGSGPNDIFAVGNNGILLHSSGGPWTSMYTGVGENLNCIWGTSGSDVYAAGDFGVILHYDGTFWQPMLGGGAENLRGVWGSGSKKHIVGESGVILKIDGN